MKRYGAVIVFEPDVSEEDVKEALEFACQTFDFTYQLEEFDDNDGMPVCTSLR